jgi:formylglycine-generating enzyme required for sulfatase activity
MLAYRFLLAALLVLPAAACAGADKPGADKPGADKPGADNDADRLLKTFVEEFVEITPGKGRFPAKFAMGSDDGPAAERPVREVTLKTPFRIAKYEVPQNLYHAVAGSNPSRWTGPRNSVEMVSHAEAAAFCRKATTMLRERRLIAATAVVRLPTEAEWEYCCRAGTATKYSFGDAEKDLGDHAWFTGNAAGNDPPVGAKKPNPWGLYDMHGYVWEWCADAWAADHKGAPADGSARTAADAKEFVLKGGSWMDKADACRSAARLGKPADFRGPHVGFRCVIDG